MMMKVLFLLVSNLTCAGAYSEVCERGRSTAGMSVLISVKVFGDCFLLFWMKLPSQHSS